MKLWLRRRWAAICRLLGGVSLRVRIIAMMLGMIGLVSVGVTWQVRSTMARALAWELGQRGISIASNLAVRSTDLILTSDWYSLNELTHDIVQNNEDVRYAFVLDLGGHVLSHSFEGGFPIDLLEANAIEPDQAHHLEILQAEEGLIHDVAIPIFRGRAGLARVGMSRKRLGDTLANVTRQILVTTLLVAVLGVAISAALTWLLTRPLVALADGIRRVAGGDLSHRLAPGANDEIGQSQAFFNTMVEQLALSRKETEAYNSRLLRRNQELSTMYAISSAVAGPLALTEMMDRAVQQALSMFGALGGWVCLLGGNGFCQLYVSAGEPIRPDISSSSCERCPSCVEAAATRQAIVVSPLPPHCLVRAARRADGLPAVGHITVPLLVKEQAVGLLNLALKEQDCARFQEADLDLLIAIGRQLGVAIENARLWEEVQRREAMRGHLLRRIITAQEDERRRIARELHDEAGQALTALLIGLRAVEKSKSLEEVGALAANLMETVTQTLDEVHDMALELRPSSLDDLGLVPALARYVRSCPARFGFQADFVAAGMEKHRLPREVETVFYRIAQEALTNVARHAEASHASILLERRQNAVVLVVEDDGQGFDVAQAMSSPEKHGRLGLYGVEERASLVGGRLVIESGPDAGTTLSVEIPVEEA